MKKVLSIVILSVAVVAVIFLSCTKERSPNKPTPDANNSPILSSLPDSLFWKGKLFSDTIKATDLDGDTLKFTLVSGPTGMTLDSMSGILRWTSALTDSMVSVAFKISDGNGGEVAKTLILTSVNYSITQAAEIVINVPDPFFIFRYPYIDTLRLGQSGIICSLLVSPGGMTIVSADSFVAISWKYPDSHATSEKLDSIRIYPVSILITNGSNFDTLSWSLRINTQGYSLTSRFQMPYQTYLGNHYLDTVTVVDDDGDVLTFSIADPSGLGVTNKKTIKTGDTTLYVVEFQADSLGTFPITITFNDSDGLDTIMSWTTKVSPKVMLLSSPQLMKSSVGIDSVYADTIDVFSEYAGTVVFNVLQGPAGFTVDGQGALNWHPTTADSQSVSIELVRGNNIEKDTLTWTVQAVALTHYLFWQDATTNGYSLQDCGPGPCLPSAAQIFQGTVATWNTRLSSSDNDTDFAIGNGLNDDGTNPASGRSAMIWSDDLCNMTGTAVRAVVRGELRDGWSGNTFVHEGRLTMKVGVIDLIVYRDLAAPLGFGGTIPCGAVWKGGAGPLGNPWNYDMQFYYKPGNPTVSIPGLMAEQIVTIQAPKGRPDGTSFSINDGLFFDLNVTSQVQWILDRKGKDYVQSTADGDYAIVFLVANDASLGGEGKINMYARECGTSTLGMGSDTPWTLDGNTMHFLVQGNLTLVP